MIAFMVFIPRSAAETILSPSVPNLYRIESEQMRISSFPNNYVLYSILVIDIDADAVQKTGCVEGDLYLPIVPDNLNDIVLFDGWHVAHFDFEQTGEYCLHIKVLAEDIANFDGTVGLFLFVTGIK